MCEVGRRKGALWDQGGELKVAGLGVTGPEGAEASASLVMVMRRVRSGRRMRFSPPWQRHRVPPSRRFGRAPNSLARPPFSHGLLFYFHRGCATQRVPKRNTVTEKTNDICFDVPMTRRERH